MAKMGRPVIFRDKKGDRVQGKISATGSRGFEAARRRLAKLAGFDPAKVGDADTIEYLARGEKATIEYLNSNK